MTSSHAPYIKNDLAIAVIGMSGTFADSSDITDFWNNLLSGNELLTRWSHADLAAAKLREETYKHPDFVPVSGTLHLPGSFDADFFGFSRHEAMNTDPQQRLLLEHCWTALESGGYGRGESAGPVGVFVSLSQNDYRQRSRHNPHDQIEAMSLSIGNDPDMAATRVSYKLGLTGPSMTVQTACSSSLVAVHIACQSLLTNECDMALCGGASVRRFEPSGYFHKQGGIYSGDGHCRPFDEASDGTLPGDGVGVVVLKRLEDALDTGDHIHAVILGTAINNDGSQKAGFTAPSPVGQQSVIESALAVAECDPGEIGYIEAHGTGTQLGDPIEFEALRKVFSHTGSGCLVGSVKGNVGHLDSTAGICGFIKTVLSVEHSKIPPTVHFQSPNAHLNIDGSGLRVSSVATDWPKDRQARIAGVSSFGIGGTNAHVILGQAPKKARPSGVSSSSEILALAAKTPEALKELTKRTATALSSMPRVSIASVAETLRRRQTSFGYRCAFIAEDVPSAVKAMSKGPTLISEQTNRRVLSPPLYFVVPGQGGHQPGLGAGLYREDSVFRKTINECNAILSPLTGWDLAEVAFDESAKNCERLGRTQYAQPVIFSIGIALARCLAARDIRPDALIGHSLGELTAACVAEVWSLEDGLNIVAQRAKAFEACAEGAMISAMLSEAEAVDLSIEGISIACVNGENLCTLAGTREAVDQATKELRQRGIAYRQLTTNRAFHTALIEPALQDYRASLAETKMSSPKVPVVSNLTGTFLSAKDARSPDYWVHQARSAVQFHSGFSILTKGEPATILELGKSSGLVSRLSKQSYQTLSVFDRQCTSPDNEHTSLLRTIGSLWMAGHEPNLRRDPTDVEQHQLIALPTYPFQKQIYMIDPLDLRKQYIEGPVTENEPVQNVDSVTATIGSDPNSNWDPSTIWPDNPIAQDVARVWADVLGTSRILKHDDFFDLGGNSLMAIQIITRLRETHTDLPMSALFDAPTVDLLANEIELRRSHSEDDDELASLIKEFEGLDAAEIERMLAADDD